MSAAPVYGATASAATSPSAPGGGQAMPTWASYTWRIDGEGPLRTENLKRPIPLPHLNELQVGIFESIGYHLSGKDLLNLALSSGMVSYTAVYGSRRNLPRILQMHALYDEESLVIGEQGVLKMSAAAVEHLAKKGIKGKEKLRKWRSANEPRVQLPGVLWCHCRECWIVSGKIVFARRHIGGRGTTAAACHYHYSFRYITGAVGKKRAKAKADAANTEAAAAQDGAFAGADETEETGMDLDALLNDEALESDDELTTVGKGKGKQLGPIDPRKRLALINPAQNAAIAALEKGYSAKWKMAKIEQKVVEAYNLAAAEMVEAAEKAEADRRRK